MLHRDLGRTAGAPWERNGEQDRERNREESREEEWDEEWVDIGGEG